MRILYICGDHGIPAFGRKGASTHLREMIQAMRALGHEVCLAAADLDGDRRAEDDLPTVQLPAPKSRKLGVDGRYLLANYLARPILARAIQDFQPDAVYERSALYFMSGAAAARQARLPRILEVNCLLAEEQKTRLHFPGLALKREIALLRGAPGIAAISETMIETIGEVAGCRGPHLRPYSMAVDPVRFAPRPPDLARKATLGWGAGDVVLGYLGSMNSYHRPAWFVDLAEKLLRQGIENVHFLIVGGSDSKVDRSRGRLVRWVDAGRVHFVGSVPQEEIPAWVSVMDAVVVPGAAPQSTPTKIFETAAMERPILLPATGPITRLCGKGAINLFPAEDFRAFETKVREFLRDPAPFREAARELRANVLTHHTWEHHAREIVAWLGEVPPQG